MYSSLEQIFSSLDKLYARLGLKIICYPFFNFLT